MNPRPSLDLLEPLLAKHNGGCEQPCDGCNLAAEVIALHRLLQFISRLGEEPPTLEPRDLGPDPVKTLERRR